MSSNDTVDTARQYTGFVSQRSWTGYADQVADEMEDMYTMQQGLDFGIEN